MPSPFLVRYLNILFWIRLGGADGNPVEIQYHSSKHYYEIELYSIFVRQNSAMEIAVGMIPSVCMLHDMDVSCRMLTLYRAPIRITPLEKLRQRKDRTSRFCELQ